MRVTFTDSTLTADQSEQKQFHDFSTFEPKVFDRLPQPLKAASQLLDGSDRQVFLASSLAVVSSLLPNVHTVYDSKVLEANLFLFLAAGFGVGKGAASYARMLAQPTQKHLKNMEVPATEDGQPPAKLLHFMPANTSKSGLVELLSQNHERGLIFESESDSLSDILKQDYGNFGDLLRKAYHHDAFSFYRRIGKEYHDLDRPCLSVLLTGTHGHLKNLLPTGTEDGLFSRFCFFTLKPNHEFKKTVFDATESLDRNFYEFGEILLQYYKYLSALKEPVYFRLTADQKEDFFNFFVPYKADVIERYGETLDGIANRQGVQMIRIAMILSALRHLDSGELPTTFFCSNEDYINALDIMRSFVFHGTKVLEQITKPEPHNLPSNKRQLIAMLPEQFTTAEAITTGQSLDIHEKTVQRFISNTIYFERLRHGEYLNKSKTA
jgi:hypothetical protein